MNSTFPKAKISCVAGVVNPQECPHCKRMFKPATLTQTECLECAEYLDSEEDLRVNDVEDGSDSLRA